MLTFLIQLYAAVVIAGGLMIFTWAAAQVWDAMFGFRPPPRDD